MSEDRVPRLGMWAFSATAIFSALALGAGELMFWPSLVLGIGPSVIWLGIFAVVLQWFINVEIARATVVSGRTMGAQVAARRVSLGVILALGATIPWIWPGWILGGAQFIARLGYGSERPIAIAILTGTVLLLLIPKNRYLWLARVQSVGLLTMLAGIVCVFAFVHMTQGGLGTFMRRLVSETQFIAPVVSLVSDTDLAFFTLLGGIVFAGAGGILNLGYGYLLVERGGLSAIREGRTFNAWMRLIRVEHGLLFAVANIGTIILISAMIWMVFGGVAPEGGGVTLLGAAYHRLIAESTVMGWVFALSGFLVFWTSAVGILDFSAKIAGDIAGEIFGVDKERLYKWLVIVQAALSAAILLSPLAQPFWLIVISGVLNTGVMASYCGILLWNGMVELPPWARPGISIRMVLIAGVLTYGGLLFIALGRVLT
jgi:hypothetical protein